MREDQWSAAKESKDGIYIATFSQQWPQKWQANAYIRSVAIKNNGIRTGIALENSFLAASDEH